MITMLKRANIQQMKNIIEQELREFHAYLYQYDSAYKGKQPFEFRLDSEVINILNMYDFMQFQWELKKIISSPITENICLREAFAMISVKNLYYMMLNFKEVNGNGQSKVSRLINSQNLISETIQYLKQQF